MARRVQVAVDCHDPHRLAAFWAATLGYQLMEPPDGYSSWAEHSRAQAEEPGEGWIKIVDPDGGGLTLLIHRVREAKVVKNRVHLDVRAPDEGAGSRRQQVDTFIESVVELGASKVREVTDDAGYFALIAGSGGQ